MRTTGGALLLLVALTACTAAPAAPAAAVLPPLPPGDQSVPWELVAQDPASRRLVVRASTGCEDDPPVQVAETAETVTVRVVVPAQVDPFFCLDGLRERTAVLAAPLGDRRVLPAPLAVG